MPRKSFSGYVVVLDFDGTLVRHEYPRIGKDIGALPWLKLLQDSGKVRFCLFTMRDTDTLKEAVEWFNTNGIKLWGIQRNPEQDQWTSSPKCHGHIFVDDRGVGIPLISEEEDGIPHQFVNWDKVGPMLCHSCNVHIPEEWFTKECPEGLWRWKQPVVF